jgi:hypothetical protein
MEDTPEAWGPMPICTALTLRLSATWRRPAEASVRCSAQAPVPKALSAPNAAQVASVADMQLSSTARTTEPPCDDAPGSPSVAALLTEAAQARARTAQRRQSDGLSPAAAAEDVWQHSGAGGAPAQAAAVRAHAPAVRADAAAADAAASPHLEIDDGNEALDAEHATGVADMPTAAEGAAEPGGDDPAVEAEADADSTLAASLPAQKRQRSTS